MKKLLCAWFAILLAVSGCTALAEGFEIEYDGSAGMAVMAAEEARDADIVSEATELPVPEAEVALPAGEGAEADPAGELAVSAEEGVVIDEAHFPDVEFRLYVRNRWDLDDNGTLSERELDLVDQMQLFQVKAANLKGVEYFRNLKMLFCDNRQLTSLDVSKNTALEILTCSSNQLKSLDVSKNTALRELDCRDNRLTALDVSQNPALRELDCSSNQLTSLDVRNNTALEELDCYDNQLTSLDVSRNTALQQLTCASNRLTSLDLSNNTALEFLSCYSNRLTNLDLSRNTWLSKLWCFSNPISTLDISNCLSLIGSASEEPETTDHGTNGFDKDKSDYVLELDISPFTTLIANGKVVFQGEKTAKSLAEAKLTVEDQIYTGKAIKPAVTVELDGVELKKGADYTVGYENNKAVGAATVTVKGQGGYTGSVKRAFKINPKQVTGLTLTAGAGKLTAKWKKVSGVTGYQLQYGLRSSFKGAKKVTVKGAATLKKAISGLKSNKTCYVRIRAYKAVNGVKYWSAWSKAVKKKAK